MPSFSPNAAHIMSEVYSYPFPEVRQVLGAISLNERFMLNTIGVEEAAEHLKGFDFEPELALPAHGDGSLNLDEIHVPVIERLRDRVGQSLKGLDSFNHAYPTHGSSPAMSAILAEWHAQEKLDSIAVLKGEYEGYKAYANNLRIPVTEYESLEDAEPKAGQVWFISNPNGTDGNWIDTDTWDQFVAAGHEIVYDAAYVGLTSQRTLDVSAPNIRAVLTSPSKTFGVFRHRNTGVTYTRDAVGVMYGTKWFKDVPALLTTLKLYETFDSDELPKQYQPVQALLSGALSELMQGEVIPSDALLLAHSKGPISAEFEGYRRVEGYRFGLTKLFEDYEARQAAA